MPLCLWCRIVIGFHVFLLVWFFCFPFKFWVLGVGWERGKLVELRESWMKSSRQCKTQMKPMHVQRKLKARVWQPVGLVGSIGVNERCQDNHGKGNKKGKENSLRCQMPYLCLKLLFSMLRVLCVNKGSSLNLCLMISSNYVVIMISLRWCLYV